MTDFPTPEIRCLSIDRSVQENLQMTLVFAGSQSSLNYHFYIQDRFQHSYVIMHDDPYFLTYFHSSRPPSWPGVSHAPSGTILGLQELVQGVVQQHLRVGHQQDSLQPLELP